MPSYGGMTTQELVEIVQQHHPDMGDTEVIKALNRAQSEFCASTGVLEDTFTETLVLNQRYYLLGDSNLLGQTPIIDIKRVDINNEPIPRFVGTPPEIDVDETS